MIDMGQELNKLLYNKPFIIISCLFQLFNFCRIIVNNRLRLFSYFVNNILQHHFTDLIIRIFIYLTTLSLPLQNSFKYVLIISYNLDYDRNKTPGTSS